MPLTEIIFISQFNVLPDKSIAVQKTTQVLKDELPISQSYWRCVLQPHDIQTQNVLGDYPYYYNLAQDAWKDIPVQ
jgi:hypothetical protein